MKNNLIKEKEQVLEPIYAFSNYIYQINIKDGSYQKVSKESGWGSSLHTLEYNGVIYVISENSGRIYAWNPKDKSCTTISKDFWGFCKGFVLYKDNFYLVCDFIYKMDPQTGKYTHVSKENGWLNTCLRTPYLFQDKIIMIHSNTKKMISWDINDGSVKVIDSGDWSSLCCFCELNNKLYAFCYYVYEVDVATGKSKQLTKGIGSWEGTRKCVVKNGEMYCLILIGSNDVHTGTIWKFNEKDGSSVKITRSDWENTSNII